MTFHNILIVSLLSLAVLLCFLCAVGVCVMRDPYQRLHFTSPVTSLAIFFITIAVFIDDSDPSARIKAVLIAFILFMMNAILSHATARAIRIRRIDQWPPKPEENIPVFKDGELHPPTERNV